MSKASATAASETKSNGREQVEAALDRASELFGLMGRIVTAGVPSHTEIPLETLREMMSAAGLGFEIPAVREKSALVKALKTMQKGGLVEEIECVPGVRLVYALMQRRTNEDAATGIDRVGYDERYMVAYYYNGVPEALRSLQTGPDPIIFFCENRCGDPREAERALRPLIDRYRSVYVARQIQEHVTLNAIYRADAFPMFPRGGYYYVRKANEAVIEQLRSFFAQVDAFLDEQGDPANPARCTLRYLNVPDAPEDREQVSTAALDMLLGEMKDIRIDLGERLKNPDKVKQDTGKSEGTATKLEKRIDDVLAKARRLTELSAENLARVASEAEMLKREARTLKKAEVVATPEAARGQRAEVAEAEVAPAPIQERGSRADDGGATDEDAPLPRAARRRPSAESASDVRVARG